MPSIDRIELVELEHAVGRVIEEIEESIDATERHEIPGVIKGEIKESLQYHQGWLEACKFCLKLVKGLKRDDLPN